MVKIESRGEWRGGRGMSASSSRGFVCEKLYKAFVTSMEWIDRVVFACYLGQAVQPSVHFITPSGLRGVITPPYVECG